MNNFKCKACGQAMTCSDEVSFTTCEACGTKQTVPTGRDERKNSFYELADQFRRNKEWDSAESIYRKILTEDEKDAEAYWSIVMCHYGIEYVENTETHKWVPKTTRKCVTPILDDENYKAAVKYADSDCRAIYEQKAEVLSETHQGEGMSKGKKKLLIALCCVVGLACIIGLAVWMSDVFIPERNYKKAIELLKEGKYEEARDAIKKSDRSPSIYAQEMIKQRKYDAAYAVLGDGNNEYGYDEYGYGYKWEDVYLIGYLDRGCLIEFITTMIDRGKYDVALTLLRKNRNLEGANDLFINAYRGKYGESVSELFFAEEGKGTFYFGSYEQDGNAANGKEKIEWIVMKKDNIDSYYDGADFLLISKEVIESSQIDEGLYSWLNGAFLNTAFSLEEQKMIATTEMGREGYRVPCEKSYYIDRDYRNIFLPSIAMIDEFMPNNDERKCRLTDYAYRSGDIYTDEHGFCFWYVVTLDMIYSDGAINCDGEFLKNEYNVTYSSMSGLRPAIWIRLE